MAIDLRTPVIVGAAQVTDRIDDPRQARTPLELMVDALHSAAIDADSPGCLTGLDLIGVAGGLWRYTDPGRQVADLVRAVDVDTLVTAWSGHSPQLLLNDLAARIRPARSTPLRCWVARSMPHAGGPDDWVSTSVGTQTPNCHRPDSSVTRS